VVLKPRTADDYEYDQETGKWVPRGGYEPFPERSPTTESSELFKPRLKLTSVAELLAEPRDSTSWVWANTLPTRGTSMLAAKPKVGKSTLARNLAVAVARGEEFLGRSTAQGPVVYLGLEEKRSEVADHFQRMGVVAEPIHIHVGSLADRALEEMQSAIIEKAAILAVVDPLFRLVRIKEGNDYSQVTAALEPLMVLARSTGCHILLVHHLGKGDREGGDAILGSTALFGTVDTAILMKRHKDQRTVESQQRYGVDISRLLLAFDHDTGLTNVVGAVEEIEVDSARERIRGGLPPEGMLEAELREAVGGNTGLVSTALRQMVSDGEVHRLGRGGKGDPYRYVLVSCFANSEKQGNSENMNPRTDSPAYEVTL